MKADKQPHFFLGCNTPQGFVSRFDQLADPDDGWRLYVIKGGPGCGKSTMMRKIADHLINLGEDVEIICCSSDVDSLDGVICHSLKFSIADGTPPHIIEPKYPGAYESIVDISTCWDEEILFANRDKIIELSKKCSKCHEYCYRFLGAAASLTGDSYRMAMDCLDVSKLTGYCKRLSQREIKTRKNSKGRESARVLSALTNKGVVSFTDSIKLLCDRVYLINDDYGVVSRILLQHIRSAALEAGNDVISCYCPLSPFEKLENIFIPEEKLGFITSNIYHDFSRDIDAYRIVNCRRFTDNDKLKDCRKRLTFNRKASQQMVAHARKLMAEAKEIHDELEGYYLNAIEFPKVDALTETIIKKIDSMRS